MSATSGMTPFEAVNHFFGRAALVTRRGDEAFEVVSGTYREVRVQVSVRCQDGANASRVATPI